MERNSGATGGAGESRLRGMARACAHFCRQPEALLLQAGSANEIVVAKMRLLVIGMLLLFAGYEFLRAPDAEVTRLTLALTGGALALGVGLLIFTRRALHRSWAGLAATVLDVTLVSLALAVPMLTADPAAAGRSEVVFSVYFLAIAATTVRMDHRGPALAGAIAMLEYAAIAAAAAIAGDAGRLDLGPLQADVFLPASQVGRLLLLACAGVLGTMIIRRAQKIRMLSATDPLTGLMNRRTFDERLAEECGRARRYGRDISLMMIDIDYFKQFNDTYGHACGDEALRSVATTLRSRLRTGDVLARYGGEEFVAILPETNAHTAMRTAELLRRAVTATPLRHPGQREPLAITVSIGVASWPDRGTEISRLQYIADKHLYEAKLAGRDQVKGPVGVRSVALSA